MSSRARAALCAAALAAALPARAGLFDDDEARRRVELLRSELAQQGKDNEARIAKLEEQIRNIGVVELVQQLQQINDEIARLRGQLEVLANENQQIQKRQRDFYLNIDSRLKRLEGGGASASAGDTAPPASASAPPTSAGPAPNPSTPSSGFGPTAPAKAATAAPADPAREIGRAHV